MRKLFMRLAAIFLVIFVLDWVIGSILRTFYYSQKGGTAYHIIQSIEKTNEDILVFGSSRAQHTYVPAIFEEALGKKCYNVGQAGMNIFYSLGVQESILKRYTPEVMILEIYPIDLLSKSAEEYNRLSYLLPFCQDNAAIREIVKLRSPFEEVKLLSRIYPFNSQILPILYNNIFQSGVDYFNGYMPLHQRMTHEPKRQMTYAKFIADKNKVESFRTFLDNAAAAGCKVFILISPFYLAPNSSYSDSYKIAKEIIEQFGVPLWDYSNDQKFQTPELFKDPIHLNEEGADLFSSIVAQRIKIDLELAQH